MDISIQVEYKKVSFVVDFDHRIRQPDVPWFHSSGPYGDGRLSLGFFPRNVWSHDGGSKVFVMGSYIMKSLEIISDSRFRDLHQEVLDSLKLTSLMKRLILKRGGENEPAFFIFCRSRQLTFFFASRCV